ncbi:hypothetical protein ACFLU5_01030 [Bacteroidota bacterium]
MNNIPDRIKKYAGIIGIFSVIFILAIVFHYPIQIVDAMSMEPAPGFDIKISIWRVIFESFFGPLLFYLRADQPLEEFTVMLIWIISLSLIILIVNLLLNRKQNGFKYALNGFLGWLLIVPLIVCTWFGLLILIIFAPLPANTIVNNHENIILLNTHCHSEHSHDGIISQEDQHEWHSFNGFDAFFITDHNHHERTLEAVTKQKNGDIPPHPLIICGEEFSGGNHMTLLGLKRNFITRGLTDQQVVDSAHGDNGIVIVAHWFDGERKSIPYFLDLNVDGFEIANQGYGLKYDQKIFDNIVNTCNENELMMVGAVDYHGYGRTCFVWNAIEIPGWHQMDYDQKRESILEVLRRKDMNKLQVLLYNDRQVFKRNRIFMSPVHTLCSYFRTLGFWQVLSWLIWLFILRYFILQIFNSNRFKVGTIRSKHIIGVLALLSSLYILILGSILISKSQHVSEHNEIYTEYGTIMLWGGTGFLMYLIVLIIIELRQKRLKGSQIDKI